MLRIGSNAGGGVGYELVSLGNLSNRYMYTWYR